MNDRDGPYAYEDDVPFSDADFPPKQDDDFLRRAGNRHHLLRRSRLRLSFRWQILISVAIALGLGIFWREVVSAAMWFVGGIVLWVLTRGGYDRSRAAENA